MKPILSLFLFIPGFALAQDCTCTSQFDWLQEKLSLNYSGYRDKVTPENQEAFDQHTTTYRSQIASATSDTACFRLLTEWAKWFRDGHVQIGARSSAGSESPETIRQRYADWESFDMSEQEARIWLRQPNIDPVEGIYQNDGGQYRVALLQQAKPDRDFVAIVLKADSIWWVPGQVKFSLKRNENGSFSSRYYMRDHSERNPAARIENGILEFDELGNWYRQYPGDPVAAVPDQLFSLRQLDASTLLLKVPTMNESVRQELDSLIRANQPMLDQCTNLIIDCRNNGGGSDITFSPLRPYVYSGNVTGYHTQIYATTDNLQKYTRLEQDQSFPKKYRKYFGKLARKMKRNMGGYIGKKGPFKQKFRKIKPNPKRVAILINGGCASSCEQFVYYAGQSNRVTLIGENTAGIMDYGNLHSLEFPCGNLGLAYPTSRSSRVEAGKGIDGVGIPPDVRIEDKGSDWVEFARSYLERQ
ncbi:MAG: hypothetical protein EP344_06405 [Bacteroidetes bacterium]|nr:MAG: hypothetical protein EP344_06405 [Bacteroidota bacterium]